MLSMPEGAFVRVVQTPLRRAGRIVLKSVIKDPSKCPYPGMALPDREVDDGK